MKLIKFSLVAALLATSAIAQALPQLDELSSRLGAQFPPYWSVDEFRLVAQSDLGDAARLRAVIRFEADAAPTSPLFLQVDSQDSIATVAPTYDEGTPYGVMDLSFRAGYWTGEVEIEVLDLGWPILVLGEPAAEARVEQLREQSESNAAARFERRLLLLQNEHNSELSGIQHKQRGELEH